MVPSGVFTSEGFNAILYISVEHFDKTFLLRCIDTGTVVAYAPRFEELYKLSTSELRAIVRDNLFWISVANKNNLQPRDDGC